MCGIAGKVSVKSGIQPGLIEAMCELQAHRGPDSRGMHEASGVALGIQRLRIIDLETGDQPIYNEDGSVAVILNGEIYNFRELRRDLARRGHTFKTEGDTEVIAHLYEEHGPGLVHRLEGMFAFAIWDERRRRLVLGRDRVGKKPLFYAEGDGWLSFASELRALMADEEIPRRVDPSSIDLYLSYGYVPHPWSIWRDVRKLPPAHTLVWEDGRARAERYWRLEYSPKRGGESREIEDELRGMVAAAVRRRMIADVPLGAFLSGGIDSSIVVSEMAASSSGPVKTFSIGFEDHNYNELPRARLIAERFSTEHHEFVVKPDAVEMIPRLVRHYGEPFADSSAIPSFYLAELTAKHVTVALNGDGGDESFAGYPRHAANAFTFWLDRVPRALRRPGAALAAAFPASPDRKNRVDYVRRMLQSLGLEAVDRYREHVAVFSDRERAMLLKREFQEEVRGARDDPVRSAWSDARGGALDVILQTDIASYLPGDLLVKMDIATMAHSLEARSPLLDAQLMQFAATLPTHAKVGPFSSKTAVRHAYRSLLPTEIVEGGKYGFAVPLGRWLREELRDLVGDRLRAKQSLVAEVTRPGEVDALLRSHDTGHRDRSAQIYALLMLELWSDQMGGEAGARLPDGAL